MTRVNVVLGAVRIDASVESSEERGWERNVGRRLTLKNGPLVLVS